MVAMRVWVKCMKSKAKSTVPKAHSQVLRKACHSRKYSAGSMSTPKSVPTQRQPKGFMPKRRIPREIRYLPRGGWVFS